MPLINGLTDPIKPSEMLDETTIASLAIMDDMCYNILCGNILKNILSISI